MFQWGRARGYADFFKLIEMQTKYTNSVAPHLQVYGVTQKIH